jgi:hypothetical protein
MGLKHTFNLQIKTDAGTVVSDGVTLDAAAEENAQIVAVAGEVQELDLAVDVSQIESFYIESDQDVTLKTNSTGSPAQTFALTGKKALWWHVGATGSNPLTTDITKLYFDNSAGDKDATVKVGFLLNVAP